MNKKRLLIVFMRNPVLGKTKTRLANDVGDRMAYEVYVKLLEHTHRVAKYAICDKIVYYSDKIIHNDIWEKELFMKAVQSKGDIGMRMEAAFAKAFSDGYQSVVVTGTDIFGLTTGIINMAFYKLKSNDFVIGPAKDGGYYLLGMNKMNYDLFRNKKWSSEIVYGQTIKNFGRSKYYSLPELTDLDTLDDVGYLIDMESLYNKTIQNG